MKMRVELGPRSYDILIEDGLLFRAGAALKDVQAGGKVLILTDENVAALYLPRVKASLAAAGFDVRAMVVAPGEKTKCLSSLAAIYSRLAEGGFSRTDALLALGGGVVGDLGGFAAATYMRGIAYLQAPTSLLAQVDSSVGGKVAVDLPEGKNLAGCFYQPRAVLIDPQALNTLDARVFADGMGEVIKYGCIADRALFDLAKDPQGARARLPEIIARSLAIKRDVVQKDECDRGERMLLNFGHTLGHALEAALKYQGLTHGEAVGVGMRLIARAAEQKGLTKPGTADEIAGCLSAWNLPVTAPRALWPRMTEALGRDKKHMDGELTLVLLDEIGRAKLYPATAAFFEEVPAWLT